MKKNIFNATLISAVALVTSANAAISLIDSDDVFNGSFTASTATIFTGYDASAADKLAISFHDEIAGSESLPTSITFGGDAFTLIAGASGNNSATNLQMYYLDASSVGGTFGTGDVVVNWSTSAVNNDFALSLIALTGTADGVSNSGFSTSGTISLNVPEDDSFVWVARSNNSNGAADPDPPLTDIFTDTNLGSGSAGSGYEFRDAGATPSYDFFGGSRPADGAVVFAAAATAAIPEPSAAALICLGGLAFVLRRRK